MKTCRMFDRLLSASPLKPSGCKMALLACVSGAILTGCGKNSTAEQAQVQAVNHATIATGAGNSAAVAVVGNSSGMTIQEKLKKFKAGFEGKVSSYAVEGKKNADELEKSSPSPSKRVKNLSYAMLMQGAGAGITYTEMKKTDNIEFGYSIIVACDVSAEAMDSVSNSTFEFPIDENFKWSGNYKQTNPDSVYASALKSKVIAAFQAGLDAVK